MNRGGALVHVVLAVLAAALAFTWVRLARSGSSNEAAPRAPGHETREFVPGLEGEVRLGESLLRVRVARRQADPTRAEFDARVLRRRFGLPEGEPFLCLLELAGAEATPGEGIDLAGLRVLDARGVALAPFPRPSAAGPKDVVDPLAVLVAPPDLPLRSGETVSILLWGRAPEGDPRLSGVAGTTVALRSAPVPAKDLASLARIDEGGPAGGEGAVIE